MKDLDFANPKTLTATPSGIEIAYFTEPRRAYALRRGEIDGPNVTPWAEVPSVTTVLGCLDKPALPWWGMGIGVEGIVKLAALGLVTLSTDGKLLVSNIDGWAYATKDNLIGALTSAKLTVNHVRDSAGVRGQSTHDALEAWATVGKMPVPGDHPPEEQPYVESLRKFCEDMGDSWETGGVEIAVGSVEHGFAGRYDLRGKTTKTVRLVTKALTADGKSPLVKGPTYVDVPACRLLLDAKTSKGIYGTHLMQLEAYEGGGVECGYEPTDARAVLHLTMHGLYEFKRARASYDDFLAILQTYEALERVKEALK